MRIRLSLLMAGVVAVASACASTPPTDTARAAIQVYPNNPFVGKPYDIAGRIWAGTSKTAYIVPLYSTKEEAIASMQNEAAGLNADALISVSCLDGGKSTWFRSNEPGFLCYGVAIKLPRAQG
jgi:uncharacterized protein YbjQ (UPF0145 family)